MNSICTSLFFLPRQRRTATGSVARGAFTFCLSLLAATASAAPVYSINLHNHLHTSNVGTSADTAVSGGPYTTGFNYTDGSGTGSAGPTGLVAHTELFMHPWIYGINGDVSMTSRMILDDVIFVDENDPTNTGSVAVSVNLDLDGALTYVPTSGTPGMRGRIQTNVRLHGATQRSEFHAGFGGSVAAGPNTGVFADLSGATFSDTFTTNTYVVPLNRPIALEFAVIGGADVGESFYTSSDRATMHADIAGALALLPFNLPEGIAVSSLAGGFSQSPTSVPAPATAFALLTALGLIRRRKSRATLDS